MRRTLFPTRGLAVLSAILLPAAAAAVTDDTEELVIDDGEAYTLGGHHVYEVRVWVAAAGTLFVASYDGSANTGSVELVAPDIDIAGTILGDGRGYRRQEGPGGSSTYPGAGGGYGGAGGASGWGNPGGAPYGTSTGPDGQMGSGGGNTSSGSVGGMGGASVSLIADDLWIGGTITVNGSDGLTGSMDGGGGGSGGCIRLRADQIIMIGSLQADGGVGANDLTGWRRCGGGGGGGRIKVFYCGLTFGGTYSVVGGPGGTGGSYPGAAGSSGTYNQQSAPEPTITSIGDVPGDQGLQVRIEWSRSCDDHPEASAPVTHYDLWRRIDETAPMDGPLPLRLAYPPGDWDFLGTVPARGEARYHCVVPTLADSNSTGMHMSTFFVSGVTSDPFVYYDSPPDSGYSVDNLAPAVPTNLLLAATTLVWDDCPEADFSHFSAYACDTGDFDTAVLLGHTVDPAFAVGAAHGWYFVTATDFAGNESQPAAIPDPATSADSPDVVPFASDLRSLQPNPFTERMTILLDVARSGPITVRVFDVAGRLVTTLLDETATAGRYTLVWDGRGDGARRAAPGVYFMRLESADREVTRKLVHLE